MIRDVLRRDEVVGVGRGRGLRHTLKFEEDVRFMDATDAVAVALCHHYQGRKEAITKSAALPKKTKKNIGSWASFIAMNPDRIK